MHEHDEFIMDAEVLQPLHPKCMLRENISTYHISAHGQMHTETVTHTTPTMALHTHVIINHSLPDETLTLTPQMMTKGQEPAITDNTLHTQVHYVLTHAYL